ncbi:hypothetical protein Fleli_0368 [Bernardetia litoralis DSM 6794]|uniref:Uncharacterized protein n=1 Tax=Bernardetia litoralis (strain ATCC 23117 / DSM 6794 / NBRC 15988 / NCIMB 1366 / Fx l1 / Sio-4) TaxID=880071 RepID=I4AFW3_BERLS|nr:hypothetical protein [Bernardetia litoralis]AFM02848.1 hypothetical protein Fleli_0368 [Bernardetia litoralis DSM 6794]
MKNPDKNTEKKNQKSTSSKEFFKDKFDYDPREDIYNQAKKAASINNEDESIIDKATASDNDELYEETPLHNAKSNLEGQTLDVPGAELDDQQESIGSEDEENNYYSLGGDNHDN